MAGLLKRGNIWYADYREGGRRRRKSLETSDEDEAKDRLEYFVAELKNAKWGPDEPKDCKPAKVWALQEEFLVHQSPNTRKLRTIHWQQFLDEFKPKNMGDVTSQAVEKLKNRWTAVDREPRPKSAKTVNRFLATMRMVYNFAAGKYPKAKITPVYTKHNPFAGIARLPDDAPEKRALTRDEAERLIRVAKEAGQDLHFFVALGLHAGLRKAEIIAARWEWIDWGNRNINIAASHGFKPKYGRKRTVPIRAELLHILSPAKDAEGFIIAPDKDGGERYRYEPRKAFKSVAKDAGVPWLTPHLLRHSFASLLAEGGVSLYKLSKWLGHSHTEVTEIYSHLQDYDADIERFGGQ